MIGQRQSRDPCDWLACGPAHLVHHDGVADEERVRPLLRPLPLLVGQLREPHVDAENHPWVEEKKRDLGKKHKMKKFPRKKRVRGVGGAGKDS